jgi:uncharacterized membrane protein (DUF2068 family)
MVETTPLKDPGGPGRGPGRKRARRIEHGPVGFRVIGVLKLGSGLLLFAAWLGMFRLFKNDVTAQLEWAARHIRLDPENRLFQAAVAWAGGLDRNHLRAIEAGTFFYALLHVVEGTGLILERYWAGYLTIVATSALVPFEVYEVFHKANPLKILVLIINIGFVIYVAWKIRQEHRALAAGKRAGADEALATAPDGFPDSRV